MALRPGGPDALAVRGGSADGRAADVVGLSPGRAARSAVPRSLERGMSVKRADGGRVRVELRLPILLRAWQSPVRVAAVASLGAEP